MTFSHWLLDLLVHRADLPILPGNFGNGPTLGFSLWQYPLLTAGIELGMIVVATWMYGRSLAKVAVKGKVAVFVTTALMGLFLTAALAVDWTGIRT